MSAEFRRWRVGEVTITRIVELGPVDIPPNLLFPAVCAERVKAVAWLQPDFVDADGNLRLNFQCFLIEAPGRKILVDTCIGDDKQLDAEEFSGRVSGFLETLERAGAGPDDVDTVLCTHMHFDHIGWNTRLVDGRWTPPFPKARYLFARTELDFALALTPDPGDESIAQSVRPVLDAGLADLVECTHQVCPEVRLEPTPGHTPGHVSVLIDSAGAKALITGDALHHPIQLSDPSISDAFCHDAAQGTQSRRRLFSELAGPDVLFIGTHFPEPTAGRALKDGTAWRLEALWDERLPAKVD